jgi:hypothetical protein
MFLKVVKAVLWAATAVLVAAAFAVSVREFVKDNVRPAAPLSPPVLTLERFRDVFELATLRLEVSEVVEPRLSGLTGGASAIVLVRGDVDLTVDLAHAALKDIDPTARTLTLTLPPPTASRPRINHAATRVVAVRRSGLWSIVSAAAADLAGIERDPGTAMLARALADGERLIATAAESSEVRRRARSHAERALTERARQLGWTARIVWSESDGGDNP